MKQLNVPYVPMLDMLDLSSANFCLEKYAHREYIDSVNWPQSYSYKPIVVLDIARSDKFLYLSFFVRENSIRAVADKDGTPVYTDSCVEFFVKQEDSPIYTNFEFNCIATCDAAHRVSRQEKTPFTPTEYAQIRRYASLSNKPFTEKSGLFIWQVCVSIPFSLMGIDPDSLPTKVLGNFYKCADATQNKHYLSWNPIDLPQPEFHCPQFFGELYL